MIKKLNSFNVYLENNKKMYLPKFFGLNRFKEKTEIKVSRK